MSGGSRDSPARRTARSTLTEALDRSAAKQRRAEMKERMSDETPGRPSPVVVTSRERRSSISSTNMMRGGGNGSASAGSSPRRRGSARRLSKSGSERSLRARKNSDSSEGRRGSPLGLSPLSSPLNSPKGSPKGKLALHLPARGGGGSSSALPSGEVSLEPVSPRTALKKGMRAVPDAPAQKRPSRRKLERSRSLRSFSSAPKPKIKPLPKEEPVLKPMSLDAGKKKKKEKKKKGHHRSRSSVPDATTVAAAAVASHKSEGGKKKKKKRKGGGGDSDAARGNMQLTPEATIKQYGNKLSPYELTEIHHYPVIYFIGDYRSKIKTSMVDFNHGYDDEKGEYTVTLHDHICYQYEVLEVLGRGSFGQVLKCFDFKTKELVAIKIIRNKKRFLKQGLKEVNILQHLKKHDQGDNNHCVHILNSFYFRNHLCISFEMLSYNLYEVVKKKNFQGMPLGLVRSFAVQILKSLKFLYDLNLIHCDLKPENILLKSSNRSAIKVIDFGSSCFENQTIHSYIQSRYYRSPEVILGLKYTRAIDIWSVGCIICELYTGHPIFPGENEIEQLACIMEVIGAPPKSFVEKSKRRKMFFDSHMRPRIIPNSRGFKHQPGSRSLQYLLRSRDPLFVKFIEGLLEWVPEKRLTAEQALQHEWIQEATLPKTTAVSTPPAVAAVAAAAAKSK